MKYMEYKEKSALPLIESAYADMTQTERLIANYFLEGNEPEDLSLKAMAGRLAVSEATLVRFAKKVGFKGYREFVFQYEKSIASSKPSENVTASSLQVLNAYQDLLTKTYSLIQEEQIARIAQRMGEMRRIFVSGIGSSGYAASEMAYRFKRIGCDMEAFTDIDMMRIVSVFHTAGDLVIGLSISGTRQEFLESLQMAKERGAMTILITSSSHEFHKRYIDEIVLVPSLLHLNYGNLISPQFPLLVMIDILYAAYMRYNRDEKEKLHTETVKMVTHLHEDSEMKP